ncbi:hypothetical protein KBY81_04115 [Cyanobium sp. Lug-B]|nr:hypothetical protein [Cyanobium sp. Lug-B]
MALFFVFMLSAELPSQIFHLAQHLSGQGQDAMAETLEHLGVLVVYAVGLVCALFLAQQELCRTRLLASYPPHEPVPLAMHVLGLVWGLLAVVLLR